MNKVIKVTDDEIFVGKEDGFIVKIQKPNVSWDVKIGDEVELFTDRDDFVINLVKKAKKFREYKLLKYIASLFYKIIPIVFSILLLISITGLLVLNRIPRGNEYTCRIEESEVKTRITISFSDDGMKVKYWTLTAEKELVTDEVVAPFKIVDGELFSFNEDTGEYGYDGKINSTKLKLNLGAVTIVTLKEKTLYPLKTTAIVVLIVSSVVDFISLVFIVLIKTKVINMGNESKHKKEELEVLKKGDTTVSE